MIDPFERGMAWYMYNKLENEFIETTSYVALVTDHDDVWSEKYGELLTRTGDLVDSFFRDMVNSKSLDNEETVKRLREKIQKKRQKNKDWSPNITDFRKTFNPIFQLSSVEVEADYGLTYYGKLNPFKNFDKKKPFWWGSYNKVKHEIFEKIEENATLYNTINALAGLFILNILHMENRRYLARYTTVFFVEHLGKKQMEKDLSASFIGIPEPYRGWSFIAKTPLFTHVLRVDEKVKVRRYIVSK